MSSRPSSMPPMTPSISTSRSYMPTTKDKDTPKIIEAPTKEPTNSLVTLASPTKAPTTQCYERGSNRFFTTTKAGKERSLSCRTLAKRDQKMINYWCAKRSGATATDPPGRPAS